jgi:N-glycosylase/DNA lyase
MPQGFPKYFISAHANEIAKTHKLFAKTSPFLSYQYQRRKDRIQHKRAIHNQGWNDIHPTYSIKISMEAALIFHHELLEKN